MNSPQNQGFTKQLEVSKQFFNRSTRVLEEPDSEFRPQPGMMTVAQQVAHTAQTIEWFVQGVTSTGGFDLNFDQHAKELQKVTSLVAARKMLEAAFSKALQFVRDSDLASSIPPGPIMGGQPLGNIVWAIVEHTAHHRGALTVYSRQLGKVPPMPYMD